MKPILALFASRKFILVLAALIVVTVLVATKALPVSQFAIMFTTLTGVLVASIAHEDAAEKASPVATGGAVTVNTNATTSLPPPPVNQ